MRTTLGWPYRQTAVGGVTPVYADSHNTLMPPVRYVSLPSTRTEYVGIPAGYEWAGSVEQTLAYYEGGVAWAEQALAPVLQLWNDAKAYYAANPTAFPTQFGRLSEVTTYTAAKLYIPIRILADDRYHYDQVQWWQTGSGPPNTTGAYNVDHLSFYDPIEDMMRKCWNLRYTDASGISKHSKYLPWPTLETYAKTMALLESNKLAAEAKVAKAKAAYDEVRLYYQNNPNTDIGKTVGYTGTLSIGETIRANTSQVNLTGCTNIQYAWASGSPGRIGVDWRMQPGLEIEPFAVLSTDTVNLGDSKYSGILVAGDSIRVDLSFVDSSGNSHYIWSVLGTLGAKVIPPSTGGTGTTTGSTSTVRDGGSLFITGNTTPGSTLSLDTSLLDASFSAVGRTNLRYKWYRSGTLYGTTSTYVIPPTATAGQVISAEMSWTGADGQQYAETAAEAVTVTTYVAPVVTTPSTFVSTSVLSFSTPPVAAQAVGLVLSSVNIPTVGFIGNFKYIYTCGGASSTVFSTHPPPVYTVPSNSAGQTLAVSVYHVLSDGSTLLAASTSATVGAAPVVDSGGTSGGSGGLSDPNFTPAIYTFSNAPIAGYLIEASTSAPSYPAGWSGTTEIGWYINNVGMQYGIYTAGEHSFQVQIPSGATVGSTLSFREVLVLTDQTRVDGGRVDAIIGAATSETVNWSSRVLAGEVTIRVKPTSGASTSHPVTLDFSTLSGSNLSFSQLMPRSISSTLGILVGVTATTAGRIRKGSSLAGTIGIQPSAVITPRTSKRAVAAALEIAVSPSITTRFFIGTTPSPLSSYAYPMVIPEGRTSQYMVTPPQPLSSEVSVALQSNTTWVLRETIPRVYKFTGEVAVAVAPSSTLVPNSNLLDNSQGIMDSELPVCELDVSDFSEFFFVDEYLGFSFDCELEHVIIIEVLFEPLEEDLPWLDTDIHITDPYSDGLTAALPRFSTDITVFETVVFGIEFDKPVFEVDIVGDGYDPRISLDSNLPEFELDTELLESGGNTVDADFVEFVADINLVRVVHIDVTMDADLPAFEFDFGQSDGFMIEAALPAFACVADFSEAWNLEFVMPGLELTTSSSTDLLLEAEIPEFASDVSVHLFAMEATLPALGFSSDMVLDDTFLLDVDMPGLLLDVASGDTTYVDTVLPTLVSDIRMSALITMSSDNTFAGFQSSIEYHSFTMDAFIPLTSTTAQKGNQYI